MKNNMKIRFAISMIIGVAVSIVFWYFLTQTTYLRGESKFDRFYLTFGTFIASHGFLFGSFFWYLDYFKKQKNFFCKNSFSGSRVRCLQQCEGCKSISNKYGA